MEAEGNTRSDPSRIAKEKWKNDEIRYRVEGERD